MNTRDIIKDNLLSRMENYVSKAPAETPRPETPSSPFQGGFYETMYREMNKNIEPDSEEVIKKREKRERSRNNILNLTDGLSAVANLWGASEGAVPHEVASLSDVNRRRYDYAERLRRENQMSWNRGMMQARMADVNKDLQESQMKLAAAKDNRDWQYKQEKDKRDFDFKIDERDWKREQDEADRQFKADQFEETKRSNKAREETARMNANTARERAAQGGSATKYKTIVGSDNQPIRVRTEAWNSYTGDVAQKIIDASEGDAAITSLIRAEYNLNPQGTLETIVSRYLHKFPEIEEYAKQRAEELESAYSGIHPASNETSNESGIDWSELFEIPNM